MFGAGLGKDCLDVQFPAKAGVERSHALLQICAQPLESINVVADLLLVGPLRAAAVKGGRRPSRRDLPLTVASTTAESMDREAGSPTGIRFIERVFSRDSG